MTELERALDGVRILVVEDDEDGGELLQMALERYGARVTLAATARDAIAIAATESFDALVSDIGLPDLDGCAMLREIHQDKPELFALALSGFSESAENGIQAAGFSAQLLKPVDPRQLVRLLQQHRASSSPTRG